MADRERLRASLRRQLGANLFVQCVCMLYVCGVTFFWVAGAGAMKRMTIAFVAGYELSALLVRPSQGSSSTFAMCHSRSALRACVRMKRKEKEKAIYCTRRREEEMKMRTC